MTLIEAYRAFAPHSRSRWRRASRAVIEGVIEERPANLRRALRAAWPKEWGDRSGWPYTEWLLERALVLALAAELAHAPTEDERAAIAVAGDLAQLGRVEEARRLLDADAPHRHDRSCPTCGAPAGSPCEDPVQIDVRLGSALWSSPARIVRDLPHEARGDTLLVLRYAAARNALCARLRRSRHRAFPAT